MDGVDIDAVHRKALYRARDEVYDPQEPQREEDADPLAPARGILNGLWISLVLVFGSIATGYALASLWPK